MAELRVCIVGGSIGGLAAALSFHRLGARVRVFEKAPAPLYGRGGSIGFVNNMLWEKVRGAPMMRRGQRASRAQGAYLYGDLWGYLYDGLPADTVRFGATVESLGDDPSAPIVDGETYDLCVISDGGWSALRERYFAQYLDPRAPIYAGYNVWRFRVERKLVPGWDAEGEYSDGSHHRTILMNIALNDGRDFVMGGSAIAAEEGTLAPPDAGASRQDFGDDKDGGNTESAPKWFLPWYKAHFGRHAGGELYRAHVAAAEHGKIAAQPQYEFAASKIVLGRLVLVGDAAHMASPRTGAGAHTAVMDGLGLYDAFTAALAGRGGNGPLAERLLALYQPDALERAAALYARSREVSADVIAPGWKRKGA